MLSTRIATKTDMAHVDVWYPCLNNQGYSEVNKQVAGELQLPLKSVVEEYKVIKAGTYYMTVRESTDKKFRGKT